MSYNIMPPSIGIKSPTTSINSYKIANERINATATPTKSGNIFSKTLAKANSKANDKIGYNIGQNTTGLNATNLSIINASKLHSSIATKSNKNIINNMSKQDGTNLARMKRVAKDLTDQLHGFLWMSMAAGVNKNPEGGFGEEMFQKSLWPELVKVSRSNEHDSLQDAILRDLVKSDGRPRSNAIDKK